MKADQALNQIAVLTTSTLVRLPLVYALLQDRTSGDARTTME